MAKVFLDRLLWVPKDEVRDITRLKGMLTIQPKLGRFAVNGELKIIQMYEETDGYIGVPREFGLKHRKPNWEIVDRTTTGDAVLGDLTFSGELYEAQKKAVSDILSVYQNGGYGVILNAKTGSGKSVMALYIASQLGLKTLVIATKEVLMEQWISYIKKFLPRARYGIIRQDIDDSDMADICVGMIHSLSMRTYSEIYDRFGFVIWDEVHRVGAEVFSLTSKLFSARYRLGISATTYRWDGADKVFLWSIGDVISFPEVPAMTPLIYPVATDFALPSFLAKKNVEEMPVEFLLRFVISDRQRNQIIVDLAERALRKGRKVLILSHRRKHLDTLYKMLLQKVGTEFPIDFVVGGRSAEEIEEAKKRAKCLFGTYQYIGEGFDCPDIDTLILATPVSNPIQAVGRVMRLHPNKKEPVVVDLVDMCEPFRSMYQNRKKHYVAAGYKFTE